MKKYIFAVLAILVASSAFGAAQTGDASAGLTIGTSGGKQTTVKGSKGVNVSYNGVAQGYVLGAYHGSGTQTFGTSSGDTKIFKADGTGFSSLPTTVPTGSDTADFTTGWTAM